MQISFDLHFDDDFYRDEKDIHNKLHQVTKHIQLKMVLPIH